MTPHGRSAICMEGIDLVQSATPNIVGVNQYAMGKFTIEQGSRRLASSASHDGSLESKKKCTLEPNKKSTNIELCSAAVDLNQNRKNKSLPLLTAWDLDYPFDVICTSDIDNASVRRTEMVDYRSGAVLGHRRQCLMSNSALPLSAYELPCASAELAHLFDPRSFA